MGCAEAIILTALLFAFVTITVLILSMWISSGRKKEQQRRLLRQELEMQQDFIDSYKAMLDAAYRAETCSRQMQNKRKW